MRPPRPRLGKKPSGASLESTSSAQSIEAFPRTNRPPATPVRAHGSISRQIPCSGPKGGNNSLLAQINSLLVRVGEFALQATEFADVFETDFREKAADSAKFPAFFPVTRELCTSGDREFIHGKPQRSLLSGTGHARKRCGARAASYSMNGWIPLSRE
jgi:hypothetical protein